jgi:hypothetical protein
MHHWDMKLKPQPSRWRQCLFFLVGTAALLVPCGLAAAAPVGFTAAPDSNDDASNPYSIITERNIFHLNPPPPPPEPEKPKVELPVVKITGFLSVGTRNKVLFSATSKDEKETAYYSLVEGEKEKSGGEKHELELVKIHPTKDAVDVMNDGVLVTLTLKDDGARPSGEAAAPAPAPAPPGGPPAPVMGGMPGRPMFPPRTMPPGMPVPNGNFNFPGRARRNLP